MFKTPILFLIFNRPDTTERVFERIRQAQPSRLYVAADGPRPGKPGEKDKCDQTRAIIERIDWDCELKTLFRKENRGCKDAVSSAITWFFEQEEYGIILEDDCLPDLSFFPFCEELLIKYKDDERIGNISGNNFLPKISSWEYSYDFSSIVHIWGWATWRRVWQNFDLKFKYWEDAKRDPKKKRSLFNSFLEKVYFSSFLSDSLGEKKGYSVWDVQYFFLLRVQHQLSIYPSANLVTNIGLNSQDATHTSSKASMRSLIPEKAISFPLQHPEYILRNKQIDNTSIRRKFFSYKRLLRYFLKLY